MFSRKKFKYVSEPWVFQDLREGGTKIYAVAIGDENLMDMDQIRKLVQSSSDLLELSQARSADDLADQLLRLICE